MPAREADLAPESEGMRIHHKLLIAFSVLALMAGIVAIFSLNATHLIVQSFEGGEEQFRTIIKAANEATSLTRQAESHLLLYLTLHDRREKTEFQRQLDELRKRLTQLARLIKKREAYHLLLELQEKTQQLTPAGNDLLEAHDAAGADFLPQEHRKMINTYFTVSESVVATAIELANLETDFLNKQLVITSASDLSSRAKRAENRLMLYLSLNSSSDLQDYLRTYRELVDLSQALSTRLRDPDAVRVLTMIREEVNRFGEAGNILLSEFRTAKRNGTLFSPVDHREQINTFHRHGATIQRIGLGLAGLMTDIEYSKKTAAVRTADSIQKSVFYLVVLGGLLVLILGYYLSRAVAAPIVKLEKAAEEIGRGNMDINLEINDRNELGSLARSFRSMAAELQNTQQELLDAKEYTDNILLSMSDALLVFSPEGICLKINSAAARLLDDSEEKILGRAFSEFFADAPPFRFDDWDQLEKQARLQGRETFLRARDGQRIPVSLSSSIMHDGEGKLQGIVCVVQDITEKKQAMEELARLATVIDQAAEGIAITDTNGMVNYVNPAFEKITGYARPEVEGRPISMLKSGRHPAHFYRKLWETIKEGKTWSGHFVNRKKDGTLYEEDCLISPVRDDKGTIINYVALKRDVTNELRLERQLQQAQRHEALGTLAGGIAHDFNNILTAIMGYASLSMNTLDKNNKTYSYLEKIIKGGERAADLVTQILTFSRQSGHEKRPVLLQPMIKEALKLLRGTLPSTIEIQPRIDAECGMIMADPTHIHQLIMNLCTNAYHAMRETGGVLKVELEETMLETDKLTSRLEQIEKGRYARLIVSDTGHGIDKENLERIFEPYFTTKKADEGTGLGLATVHGIIKGHEGVVNVFSEPGEGATFEIFFPITDETGPEATDREEILQLPDLSGRVLFVDDEENIVSMATDLLEQLGCTVEARTDSTEALALFQHDPTAFDLVITDQTMPKLTGYDLAGKILALRPDIPVILCTGYSETVNELQAKAIGISEFMMKPLVLENLAVTMDKLLNRR